MALDPPLILSGVQKGIENARPFSNLMAGAEQAQRFTGEQQRQNLLAQQGAQRAALAPLQQQALEQDIAAGEIQQQVAQAAISDTERNRALTGIVNIASQANALPVEQQAAFIRNNVGQFDIEGVQDLSDELAGMTDSQIIEALPKVLSEGQRLGIGAKTATETASQKDFDTYQKLKATDPEKAEIFGRQAGFIRPTEQEKADISVDKESRKQVEKANIQRKQGFVDTGVEAADSTANIRRSIELLDLVETGGFDSVAFRARQLFGVEGADEGELSANLGKAVLAQLKPIFGAAFTAAEGERLERIEAGFGRSPETNKRLLSSALKIAERSSRRGLAAAEALGDEFAADEIRAALVYEPLGQSAPAQAAQQQQQQQPSSITLPNGIVVKRVGVSG
jgi:hypothetical protein